MDAIYRFDDWSPGNPDGSGDCAAYSLDFDYHWDDIPCGNYSDYAILAGFICEKDIHIETTTTSTSTTEMATSELTESTSSLPTTTLQQGTYCIYQ